MEERHLFAVDFLFNAAPGTPQNVIQGFEEAGDLWRDFIDDDVTVVINIAVANLMGPLGSTANITRAFSYTAVRNALAADATSIDDVFAASNLPAGAQLDVFLNLSSDNPNGSGSLTPYVDGDGGTNNTTIEVPRANARALGLIAADDPGADGTIRFDTINFTFDFDRSDGITPGQTDFVFVASHEIGHLLGFDSGVDGPDANDGQTGRPGPFAENDTFSNGQLIFGPSVLDLYRSSAASITAGADIDLTADNRPKNFSLDGGATVLGTLSRGRFNGDGSQASHWEDVSPADAIGIMDPNAANGEFGFVTGLDLVAFDVIGWDLALDDRFEANNTIGSATAIGSEPEIVLQDLTISNDDEDFFRYTANSTGKLVVNALFNDDAGDIDLQVLDINGNLIASSLSTDDDETIIIPVVGQQTYFIRVFGFPAFAINEYTLEIENFATPVPTGVHLDPASDTGMMNNDDVTSDTTPTVFIQTDVLEFVDSNLSGLFEQGGDAITALNPGSDGQFTDPIDEPFEDGVGPGIAVEVTFVNTTNPLAPPITGIAQPVVDSSPEVYRFTPSAPLAPGVYFVTARTKVFDGRQTPPGTPAPAMGRSNASPPLWVTIQAAGVIDGTTVSADMIAASDTGMRNDDNVTNKMQPAFVGIAPAGSKVRFFANGQLVGQTVAGSDTSDVGRAVGGIGGAANDGLGLWEVTVEPLADGGYDVVLDIEDPAGNVGMFNPTFNAAVPGTDFVVDTVEPNTPLLDLVSAPTATSSDTGRDRFDNITKDNTPTVTMTSSDLNVSLAQLLFTDNLKFRIFDRFENFAEFLLYDSASDLEVDAVNTALDMFTALTLITETLPAQFFADPPPNTNNAVLNVGGVGVLADGVHNLKLEVEDRAGNISHDFILQITVDTTNPPVAFGLPDAAAMFDGLHAESDTGVVSVPTTFADRVTSDTTPKLWGLAEADTVVRVFLDRNNNGAIDLATDTFLGQTVAVPIDGNDAFPDGYWELTSVRDLNEIPGVQFDGLRRLLVTAEDQAGNPMPVGGVIPSNVVDELQIFIDTQGPRITDILPNGEDFDLFLPKPGQDGFTPLVNSLKIAVRDLPLRLDQPGVDNDFLYEAIVEAIAENPGSFLLVGDHVGQIPIESITVMFDPVTGGSAATAMIIIDFFEPLPDDRYTLTIRDDIVDPAGNLLDGESNAIEPQAPPFLPSGNLEVGGDFVARFTVDSRPEIGSFVAQDIDIDINGNFVVDPANAQIGNDATNVDISFTLPVANADGSIGLGGYNVHDILFAGKFRPLTGNGNNGPVGAGGGGPVLARFFDQLAAFGFSAELGVFRWIVDTDSNGVVTDGDDIITTQPTLANFNVASALPVAGEFDGNPGNGDEIGLYNGGRWALDRDHDFVIEATDTFITNNLFGHPIVGDFDGDGLDDLAVFNNNVFSFNLANDGTPSDGVDASMVWGYPGVLDRPVAADMDQDGIDDLGLWVPRTSASLPRGIAEWYFKLSDDFDPAGVPAVHTPGSIAALNHAFTPVPFGADLYAEFGDERSLPIVGNFDPPVAGRPNQSSTNLVGDYDDNGRVEQSDYTAWRRGFGSTGTGGSDGNRNGVVDAADFVLWRKNLGQSASTGAALVVQAGGSEEPASAVAVANQSFVAEVAVGSPAGRAVSVNMPAQLAAVDGLFAELAGQDLLLTALSLAVDDLPVEELAALSSDDKVRDEVVDGLIAQLSEPLGKLDPI